MSLPLVHVEHVNFGYGDERVLEDVTLDISRGEYVGLIGPNGSGKSTLLKLMLGILPRPKEATINLFGTPVERLKERWRIGYVAQKATSFNSGFPATVEEVVLTGLAPRRGLFRFFSAADKGAARAALDAVGMTPFRERLIGNLSGGQQQRVFIARALVAQPELLILDEPTVGVDMRAEQQFYDLIRDLRQALGLTVILVSHDVGAVGHEVTTLLCLNKQLHYHGAPDQFGSEEQLCELYGHPVRNVHHHHH
jgi:zinc transport system ATP-binding protein